MSNTETMEETLKKRFLELSNPMSPIPTGMEARLKKLSDIRFVMYDFYGTLFLSGVGDIGIDDGTTDAALMNEALEGAGLTIKSENAGNRCLELYNEAVVLETDVLKKEGIETPEPDIRRIWEHVLSRLKAEELIETAADLQTAMRISVEFEARMNPVWPADGVIEALSDLKERGFRQGIISNSQFYTPIVLETLTGKSIDELGFDNRLMHWSFEEKMKKPDLAFYKRFLDKLAGTFPDALPNDVLYIGNDMLKDIWPASTLGMKTALFAGDKRSLKWHRNDNRCKNLEPDVIITDFRQLEEIL